MNCKNIKYYLVDYAEGLLNDAQKLEIDAHLGVCPECSAAFLNAVQAWNYIEEDKKFNENPFLFTRLEAALQQAPKVPLSLLSVKMQSSVVGFSIVLVVAIGIFFGNYFSFNQLKLSDTEVQTMEVENLADAFSIGDVNVELNFSEEE